jgi:hypothetical protein
MWQETKHQSASRRGSQQRRYDAVDAGWSLILAAAVTGAFGLLTVIVSQFRKENRRDHDVVMGMLKYMNKGINRAEIKLDKVSEKLSDHLENHPK